MPRPTPLAPRPAMCLAYFVLVIGTAGCGSRAVRPDAHVARIVEREDLRQARTAARKADVEPVELASAGVALEALELIYVPTPRQPDAAPALARAPVPAGWHEAPASWLILPAPDVRLASGSGIGGVDQPAEGHRFFVSLDGDSTSDGADDPERRGGGNSKPRVRLNLLNLKINDNPISFSGSLKGTGNLILRATIRF
jgi:hypothetical protein